MTAAGFYSATQQGARGYSALEAGFASSPAALGAIVGGPLGIRLVRRWSLRLTTATALTVAGLAMGTAGSFGLHTSLVWIEIVVLVQACRSAW
jgi:hypothetical protein